MLLNATQDVPMKRELKACPPEIWRIKLGGTAKGEMLWSKGLGPEAQGKKRHISCLAHEITDKSRVGRGHRRRTGGGIPLKGLGINERGPSEVSPAWFGRV